MPSQIKPNDFVLHFLNVGFGDNIVIELPANSDGVRKYGVVDCRNGGKTISYLDHFHPNGRRRLEFVCATHPHYDHISGISALFRSEYYPIEFWDSGFRHSSNTYKKILKQVVPLGIKMKRVSSGMEWYYGKIRITALAPSVLLRNRYATYGVDMNNASIVLRIEHNASDAVTLQSMEYSGISSHEVERKAGKSVAILTGDAEFDSWAHIVQEYPKLERASEHKPLVKKMINYLNCDVIKVAHHGSMHSTPLDIYEKLSPALAIISTKQEKSKKQLLIGNVERDLFPHSTAVSSLEESKTKILTTDGSYERQIFNDKMKDSPNAQAGSIIVVIPPGRKSRHVKMTDTSDDDATPPLIV